MNTLTKDESVKISKEHKKTVQKIAHLKKWSLKTTLEEAIELLNIKIKQND